MHKFSYILLMLALISVTSGCKKDDNCDAGTGGAVTLVLFPEHHGEPIYNLVNYPDSAFIKFDAEEFPGDDPSQYDIVETGLTGTKKVTINGLKCGKYYIFMTGWDTSLQERVKGGIPYEFSQEEGSISLIIPVTED